MESSSQPSDQQANTLTTELHINHGALPRTHRDTLPYLGKSSVGDACTEVLRFIYGVIIVTDRYKLVVWTCRPAAGVLLDTPLCAGVTCLDLSDGEVVVCS